MSHKTTRSDGYLRFTGDGVRTASERNRGCLCVSDVEVVADNLCLC